MKAFLSSCFIAWSLSAFGQLDMKNKAVQHSLLLSNKVHYPLLVKQKNPEPSILVQSKTKLPDRLLGPTAFFCRIEDAIAKTNGVNFKFRLGLVDYVDAMEGKGYFQAVSYSRATNFAMQFQPKK